MIGDHQHSGRFIGKRKQRSNFTIHFLVVIVNCAFESVASLVEPMRWIHIIPKRMVNSVDAHFHHHEIVPIFLAKEVAG